MDDSSEIFSFLPAAPGVVLYYVVVVVGQVQQRSVSFSSCSFRRRSLPRLSSGVIALFCFRVRGRLRDFRSASEASKRVFWKREIETDPMVVVPSQSESSFRSYRAFSFSSSRAPTRLPVGVGGVETGFLETGDREELFGPIPVEIGSTDQKLCAWTRRRQIFFLQLPASFSPSSSSSS